LLLFDDVISLVTVGQISDELAVDVLSSIKDSHNELCLSFLDAPLEVWKFVDAFAPIINEIGDDSQVSE